MTLSERITALNWNPIFLFLIIAFLPAWILFLLPVLVRLIGVEDTSLAALIGWSLAMWMPGLGAILATRKEGKRVNKTLGLNKLGKKRVYLWAWLVPILAAAGSGVITWLFGWGKFDSSFELIQNAMEALPETANISLSLLLAIQIGASLTLAPLFNTLFALGEELGWRGFLLPKLLPLGQVPAMIISGVIWGFWHTPAILQGHNYPGYGILGVGMMIVFTVLLGIFFSWLYFKTGSSWAPALAHGTVNAVAGLPLLFLTFVEYPKGGALTSVAGWMALALVIGILYGIKEIPLREVENVSRETLENELGLNPSLSNAIQISEPQITSEQLDESRYDE